MSGSFSVARLQPKGFHGCCSSAMFRIETRRRDLSFALLAEHVCRHVCVNVYEHVSRCVYRHGYEHLHGHVCGRMNRHEYRHGYRRQGRRVCVDTALPALRMPLPFLPSSPETSCVNDVMAWHTMSSFLWCASTISLKRSRKCTLTARPFPLRSPF